MKKFIITLILSLFLLKGFGQSDSLTQSYFDYRYTASVYEYERTNLMLSIIGTAGMTTVNIINYHKYGQKDYLYFGGLSLTFNIYSIAKLIQLNKKLKKTGIKKTY